MKQNPTQDNYEKMKKDAETQQDKIELRSEKVRNIIGRMPPFLIRVGNTILIVILIILAIAVYIARRRWGCDIFPSY
jgi:hypothetical protein